MVWSYIPFISWRYIGLSSGKIFDILSFRLKEVYPNLIIMGAQKSGTSSLHNYLSKHPAIFMSNPIKEPNYYTGADNALSDFKNRLGIELSLIGRLLTGYMLKGYKGEPYFGDSSTVYTFGSNAKRKDVPKKIHDTHPHCKFIYLVKNPFARMVSHYLHEVAAGRSSGTFEEELEKNDSLIGTSLYYNQLSNYFEYFDKSSFKIIIFEKFIKEPTAALEEIFDFLELPSYRYNKEKLRVVGSSRIKHKFKKEDLLIDREVFLKLKKEINEDIKKLETQMGMDLSLWDLSEEKWCKKS